MRDRFATLLPVLLLTACGPSKQTVPAAEPTPPAMANPAPEPQPEPPTASRSTPPPLTLREQAAANVTAFSFVRNMGVQPYFDGMTLGDVQDSAGGPGGCSKCSPSVTLTAGKRPPELTRGGTHIPLPRDAVAWRSFPVERGDVVEFIHLPW